MYVEDRLCAILLLKRWKVFLGVELGGIGGHEC